MGQFVQYLLSKYSLRVIPNVRNYERNYELSQLRTFVITNFRNYVTTLILCKKARNSKCVTKKCVIFLTSTS
jgi:hypothetical protein